MNTRSLSRLALFVLATSSTVQAAFLFKMFSWGNSKPEEPELVDNNGNSMAIDFDFKADLELVDNEGKPMKMPVLDRSNDPVTPIEVDESMIKIATGEFEQEYEAKRAAEKAEEERIRLERESRQAALQQKRLETERAAQQAAEKQQAERLRALEKERQEQVAKAQAEFEQHRARLEATIRHQAGSLYPNLSNLNQGLNHPAEYHDLMAAYGANYDPQAREAQRQRHREFLASLPPTVLSSQPLPLQPSIFDTNPTPITTDHGQDFANLDAFMADNHPEPLVNTVKSKMVEKKMEKQEEKMEVEVKEKEKKKKQQEAVEEDDEDLERAELPNEVGLGEPVVEPEDVDVGDDGEFVPEEEEEEDSQEEKRRKLPDRSAKSKAKKSAKKSTKKQTKKPTKKQTKKPSKKRARSDEKNEPNKMQKIEKDNN